MSEGGGFLQMKMTVDRVFAMLPKRFARVVGSFSLGGVAPAMENVQLKGMPKRVPADLRRQPDIKDVC